MKVKKIIEELDTKDFVGHYKAVTVNKMGRHWRGLSRTMTLFDLYFSGITQVVWSVM